MRRPEKMDNEGEKRSDTIRAVDDGFDAGAIWNVIITWKQQD
jgi:hypothetical protein